MASFRRKFIGGNWKCNGTVGQTAEIVARLNATEIPPNADVVVAVPALHLAYCKANLSSGVAVSAQNVSIKTGFGAYTGEITAELLLDSGVNWTIVGHSERRTGFNTVGESDEVVGQKTKQSIVAGLQVISCIGEDLAERESGVTNEVCGRQLAAIASFLSEEDWAKVVIAYEPKWAIGTGKVATPEQAEEAHAACRNWLAQNVSSDVANSVRIIYGGSVNAKNCGTLITCPNIDGFLVGGASLLPEFTTIIQSAATN